MILEVTMKTIRIAVLLLMLTTLAAPFHAPALAADTRLVSSEPAATVDPGTSPDSRAGVAAAILCGTGVGLFLETKYFGFLGFGLAFCAFMVCDALNTPDF